jgi:uncharacterized protein (DUF1778 family)
MSTTRTDRFEVRLTRDERERFERAAAQDRRSLSGFTRAALDERANRIERERERTETAEVA